MKNVTISMDEGLLKAAREYAAKQGISFQALVRSLVRQTVEPDDETSLDDIWRLADELKIDSGGWKWNREELYDRKGLR